MSLTFSPINELPFAPNFEGNDYLLIWDISQPANQARRLTFTALASFLAYTSREFEWADIINKPDTFPPAIHTHIPADIVGDIDNLPSGTLIGGIAHFTGEAPPATRRDGSPLQSGDRFLKSDGENFSWSGALWLGKRQIATTAPASINATTVFNLGGVRDFSTALLFEICSFSGVNGAGAGDPLNTYSFQWGVFRANGVIEYSPAKLWSDSDVANGVGLFGTATREVPTVFLSGAPHNKILRLVARAERLGSATLINSASPVIVYREALL